MDVDAKIAILARAILQLSERGAVAWDYDNEQSTTTGINLDMESELKEIAEGKDTPHG